ncbi:MAG: ABC transporter ATP-binding protein/permease [Clostridiales bacterium]|jgi:ATP-binding cassette subfamily B protein|nr:ABC transporter ATP-binding protein/permease [Clostridiales bacterium]
MPEKTRRGAQDENQRAGGMSEYVEKKHRRTLLRLLRYFGVSKAKTALALTFSLLFNATLIAQPLVVAALIRDFLDPGIYDFHAITLFALAYIGVTLVGNGSRYAQQITLVSLGQQILHRLRTDLFSHIQTMNMRFFDRNSSGRILTRLTSDVEELQDLYANVFIMAIREGILIIGMIVTMFALDPGLALWCLLAAPVVAGLTVAYRFIARRNFIELKTLLSRINGYLAEHVVGMRVIQIFNREERKYNDFLDMNTRYYRLGLIRLILNSLSNPLIVMISNLMVAILVGVFGERVGLGLLDIAVLYTFTTYIRQLFDPIAQLSEQLTTAQSALISADRIFDILDNTEDTEDLTRGRAVGADSEADANTDVDADAGDGGSIDEHGLAGLRAKSADANNELAGLRGEIEFKNVWFAYNGDEWVLRDVSFKILPGRHAAFVGATGSGKTTIMSLILRYYVPQRGRILLDGAELGEYNLQGLRRAIAIVMQDVFLFSGDIEYNIRLGNEGISHEQVVAAAAAANCDALIRSQADGYAHSVAERGSDFSLGQRQLISFARALAVQPSVLILDEATASVDTETEQAIQEGLVKYAEGRTLVVIAHRISTIVNSDVIYALDHGRIVEQGTHESLLAIDGGLYRKLYLLSMAEAAAREYTSRGA